jgi:hypothetical protein
MLTQIGLRRDHV